MEEIELIENLNNQMNIATREWQHKIEVVINHLLYDSGHTIVRTPQSKNWMKLDSQGKPKATDLYFVDTILNGATHSVVDRINEIVQLIGSNQEVYLEKESKKWMVRACPNPPHRHDPDPPDPHVPDPPDPHVPDPHVPDPHVRDRHADPHIPDHPLPLDHPHGDRHDADPPHRHDPDPPDPHVPDPHVPDPHVLDRHADPHIPDHPLPLDHPHGDRHDADSDVETDADSADEDGKKTEGQEVEGEKERLTKGQDAEEGQEGERGCPPISIPTRKTCKGKGGMEIEELEEKGEGKRKQKSEAGQLVPKRRKQGHGTIDGKLGEKQITKDGKVGTWLNPPDPPHRHPDPPDPHVPDHHADPHVPDPPLPLDRGPHHPHGDRHDTDSDGGTDTDADSDSDYYDYAAGSADEDDDKMEPSNLDKGKKTEGQEDEGEKERLTKGQDAEEEEEGERGCPPISIATRKTCEGKGGMEIEELEEKGEGEGKKESEAGQIVPKKRKQGPGTIDGKVGEMHITKDGADATTQEDKLGGPSLISKTKGRGMITRDESGMVQGREIRPVFQIMKPGLECLVQMENIVLKDEMPLWAQLEGGDNSGLMRKMLKEEITWINDTFGKLYYNASHFKKCGKGCTTEDQAASNASIMSAFSEEGMNSKFKLDDFVLGSLKPGNWLFEKIINKYRKLLYNREISDRGVEQARFYIFETKIFSRIKIRNVRDWPYFFAWRSRARVKEGISLGPFESQKVEFLIFPVCNGSHFILLIFNISKWELLILDSQTCPNLAFQREAAFVLIMVIKNMLYIRAPKRLLLDKKVTCFSPQCIPKQTDESSCGVYNLLFMDAFTQNIDLTKVNWTENDITNSRFRVALELLKGKLI